MFIDICCILVDFNFKVGWNVVEENIGVGNNVVIFYKMIDLFVGNVVFCDIKLFVGSVNKS